MKNVFNLMMSLMLILLMLSCQGEEETTPPAPGPSTGAITPIGTPEGTAITATIGPAGGTLKTADERIKVVVPAGALSSNQTVSVQPITNHIPAGTGPAFRLLPHGVTFSKPVSITFRYSQADVAASAPQLLRIGFQNEKGIWQSPPLKSIDTTAHTVTVQTSHFSDWGLFQRMFVNPQTAILDPGGRLQLDVFETVIPTASDDELAVPLPVRADAKHIERWQFTGEGTLTPNSTSADYRAPSGIPAVNPVAIAVSLKGSVTIEGREYKDIRLVSNVYVAPEGISVQIDGGDWQTFPGGANINSTQNVVTGKIGSESASVIWKGAPSGTYHWTKSTDVAFNMLKGPMIYQHIYGTQATVSGGSLKVDDSHPTWALGTFTLQPAGWIRPSTPPDVMGTSQIKGFFG